MGHCLDFSDTSNTDVGEREGREGREGRGGEGGVGGRGGMGGREGREGRGDGREGREGNKRQLGIMVLHTMIEPHPQQPMCSDAIQYWASATCKQKQHNGRLYQHEIMSL